MEGRIALVCAILIGIAFFLGIYLLIGKLLVSILLGLAFFGLVYFIAVGTTLICVNIQTIKKLLQK